ncbi:MAG: exodeoxyribonuclease VII large subunit, partial [bacterium]
MQDAERSLTSRLQRMRLSIHNSQLALARIDIRRPLVETSKRLAALDLLARQSIATTLNQQQRRFATIGSKLHALSPLAVLGRGYTMTTDPTSSVVTRARDVKPGQSLVIHFADGLVDCDVVSIKLK